MLRDFLTFAMHRNICLTVNTLTPHLKYGNDYYLSPLSEIHLMFNFEIDQVANFRVFKVSASASHLKTIYSNGKILKTAKVLVTEPTGKIIHLDRGL